MILDWRLKALISWEFWIEQQMRLCTTFPPMWLFSDILLGFLPFLISHIAFISVTDLFHIYKPFRIGLEGISKKSEPFIIVSRGGNAVNIIIGPHLVHFYNKTLADFSNDSHRNFSKILWAQAESLYHIPDKISSGRKAENHTKPIFLNCLT